MSKRFSLSVFLIMTLPTSFAMEMVISNSKECVHTENIFNCSGQGLTTLPEAVDVPLLTETLDLSFNNIENISFLNYHELSQTLSALNLSHNKITTIGSKAFKNLMQVVFLDLSNNGISGCSLKNMDLSDLKRLNHLKLNNNPLRVIHSETFGFLEHPAVTHLHLSYCEINELEKESIDIRSLEYLDLSWNYLTVFKELAFHMMPNLKILDLSHNRITVLNEMPYMPALVTWILDDNIIGTIDIKEKIEDFADNLQELYLRHNNILRFNASNLPLQLDSLWLIDISNNKLHCDCRMKWITSSQYNFNDKSFNFVCSYPSSVRNRNLLSLSTEDLTCSMSSVKTLLILLICTVIFVGLSLSGFFIIRNRRRRKRLKRLSREDDNNGDYTAVYNREDEDAKLSMSDDKHLLKKDQNVEFDV